MREPNQYLTQARQRKAALLPRAAAMAGAGRSYEEIGAALGIAKSTVCNWLRDRPLGRAAARALGTPRMTARLAARYESMYHRALREWNRSRTDRRTESVVTITPADGSPTTKTTVRTEPRIGSAACLGKALAATQALEGLHRRERSRRERLEELASGAAAGKEEGVTRTVKTTTTPSGRKVQTVVTTRSGGGGPAALRDAQQALDAKRLAVETRLEAAEGAAAGEEELRAMERRFNAAAEAADEEACGALEAAAAASAAPACSPAMAADEQASPGSGSRSDSQRAVPAACDFAMAHSLASASGFDGASGSDPRSVANASGCSGAGAVNGRPAKKRRDWRKSFVPKDLRVPMDELSGVSRSATLVNELLQKRGRGKVGG